MQLSLKKITSFFDSKEILIAYIILLLILVGSSGAFLFQNNLLAWDHWGHTNSAKLILENSWPDPVVWDSGFFNGYPQNQFYPPLFSWIISTIGFVVPIVLAYKLFVIFLYFLTPIVCYKFARVFWEKKQAQILTLVLTLSFFIPDYFYFGEHIGLGGTIFSTFEIGLVPSLLGFLILIYFITCFEKKQSFIKLGILFALGVLAHYLFLIAVIYLLIKLIKGKNLPQIMRVLILGFGLSAFWWIPLLFNKAFLSSAFYHTNLLNLISIIIIIGIIIFFKQKNAQKEKELFIFVCTTFLIILLAEKASFLGQLYRVLFPIAFFSIPLLFYYLNQNKKHFKKIFNYTPLIFVLLIMIFSLGIDFGSQTDLTFSKNFEKTTSSSIILGSSTVLKSHHALFYKYFDETSNTSLKGLFVEQSPNMLFFAGVLTHINPREFNWGTTSLKGEKIDPENLDNLFNLLGVSSIITTEKINPEVNYLKKELVGSQDINYSKQKILWFDTSYKTNKSNIYYYTLKEKERVEPLIYVPDFYLGDDWKKFSAGYLANYSRVVTNEQLVDVSTNPLAKITNFSRTTNKISFFVDSNVTVPVLIKESFFPKWKAYVNGKPTKIYIATPYFMLIPAKGNIELVFEKDIYDQFSILISILFGVIVLFYIIFQRFF
jgi:hypothetical protein